MDSTEIRKRFINYFTDILKDRDLQHVEVRSSSLVPENHPTLLFTNSGMVQFTPYFLGKKDPVEDFGSKRLCSVQKVIRTGDLDKIGKSKYHLTFFEMLGSWSIGDYGKKVAVELAFDLLTNKEYGFELDPEKFIPTVFAGSNEAQCDYETIEAWKSVGIPPEKISKLPASENWWAPGGPKAQGPCGPCTEVLYDRGPQYGPEEETPGLTENPRYLEIWNAGVFMQYNRKSDGTLEELEIQSVDTGAGFERFAVLKQGVDSIYETDLFIPIIQKIKELQKESDSIDLDFEREDIQQAIRRSADHIKAATFVTAERVYPSSKDQGYVLRRLLRRVFNDFSFKLAINPEKAKEVVPVVTEIYREQYPEIDEVDHITDVFNEELKRYLSITKQAKHVIKRNYVYKKKDTIDAFDIYQSTGASLDTINKIAEELDMQVNATDFDQRVKEHREKSKEGAKEKFKGGLKGDDEKQRKMHTATHLLHQALRMTLGEHVHQTGSNITPERLRFDFSHPEKVTQEQLQAVEKIVNDKIQEELPVNVVKLPKEEAEKTGALHFFKEKYGDTVTVYYIGNSLDDAFSKEFCGGPHVKNTKEIGKFKIIKETSVGKGVRRIKAVVE